MQERDQEQEQRDELALDAETVKDLEVDEENAEQVRGGGGKHTAVACPPPPTS